MKKKYNITTIENPNHIFASNSKSKNQRGPNKPADFEEAITAAKYGKFNILVLLAMFPSSLATSLSTTTMSYVFPIAQCDLDLSLNNKGVLNSITYIGMISSGFLFGYLTDAVGRRKLIIYAYAIDFVLVMVCGLSQQYIPLLVVKFLNGFVVNGGYAAYQAYVNEFHAAKYRPLIPLYNAISMNLGSIIITLLAWLIFSDNINVSLFGGFIELRSWNIFLFVCAIPSLLASIIFFMMPESPKFLMSAGQNKKALQVFRSVYSVNTGLSPDTYPIRALVEEKLENQEGAVNVESGTKEQSCVQSLIDGWHETTRLFHRPFFSKMILVLIIHFGYLLGLNTLRLWLPQLLIAIYDHRTSEKTGEFDLCSGLETLTFTNDTESLTCTVNYDNKMVYIYILLCGVAITGFLLVSLGIIAKISKRKILVFGGCISGVTSVMIYFAQNLPVLTVLYTIHVGLVYVTSNVVIAVVVNVFPTSLRALAIALTMGSGRTGSFVGNAVFPLLLSAGCVYPFATIGAVIISASLLTLLLPDAEMTPLK